MFANSSITEEYRRLSGRISEGVRHINEVSKLFKIPGLELATRTFFHDLKFPSNAGYRRVNKKNLPKLSNVMVSYIPQMLLCEHRSPQCE